MKMSMNQRDSLPKEAFAIPEKRQYPIHDEEHARMALSMVAAHGSPDEQRKVRAAVKKRYPGIKVDGEPMNSTMGKKPSMMSGKGNGPKM